MLKASGIDFSYNENKIINDVHFTLKKGDTVALLGRSGSGKTTLFRLLSGLLKPQKGSIERSVPFSYMMQDDLLLPWRTVKENLSLISELSPHNDHNSTDNISHVLRQVQLTGLEDKFPCELSGGMRQRLALARTLLQNNPLLFLDEPFGALDVTTREQMYELIAKQKEQRNLTILLITHDFHDVIQLCDKAFILRDGTIETILNIPKEAKSDPHIQGETELLLRSALAGIKEEMIRCEEKLSFISA